MNDKGKGNILECNHFKVHSRTCVQACSDIDLHYHQGLEAEMFSRSDWN